MTVLPTRYVRPQRYADISGYTVKAIERKIESDVWREGHEYRIAPDGDILIDVQACPRRPAARKKRRVRTALPEVTHDLERLEHLRAARQRPIIASGIYFLFKGEDLVYVGQSANIIARACRHDQKDWDTFAYIETGNLSQEKREILERAYILAFNPRYNRQLPGGGAISQCRRFTKTT